MAWHLTRCLIVRRIRSEHPDLEVYDHPRGQVRDVFDVGDPDDIATWEHVPGGADSLRHFGWFLVQDLTVDDTYEMLGEELEKTIRVSDPCRVLRVCRTCVSKSKMLAEKPNLAGRINRAFDPTKQVLPVDFLRFGRPAFMRCVRDRKTEPRGRLAQR